MKPSRSAIPLCRSEFLQDVTIALGRRSLKSLRYNNRSLQFAVSHQDSNGEVFERLEIEVHRSSRGMTAMILWENGTALVYFRVPQPNKSLPTRKFELHANLSGMDAEDVAGLIRATLADFASVRHIWQQHAIPS